MTEQEDHQAEAERLLASRLEDFRYYNALESVEDCDEDHGDVYEYGLEWAHEWTNHRTENVTFRHVLSTGGPHDEFQVEFTPGGAVESVTFVYLPWFDRVEIHLRGDDADTAEEFYERYYADFAYQATHG